MARPLSPEKRSALLQAATQAVAEQGVLASTASIARRAGVAEGTLFTYFETKDLLFQALYLHLKRALAEALMPGYPHEADCRARLEHVFQRYVGWGLADPAARSALARLAASGHVSDDTLALVRGPFEPVLRMMEDGVRDGALAGAPTSFHSSVIEHIADITIEHVVRYPDEAERYRELGFHALWRAVTR